MDNTPTFLKTNDNKIINQKHIHWVQKIGYCLHVCTRSIGCNINNGTTHQICKLNNPHSFHTLNTFFL